MPKLERLLDELTGKSDKDSDTLKALANVSATTGLLERVKVLENALEAVVQELSNKGGFSPFEDALEKRLNGVESLIEENGFRPTDLSEVQSSISSSSGVLMDRIDDLNKTMRSFTRAVESIELPAVNIPEYEPPDLTPLYSQIQGVAERVDGLNFEVPEMEFPKREWTFDVKRNQSGFIRSVEVTEK
jgi:hypothetical protein